VTKSRYVPDIFLNVLTRILAEYQLLFTTFIKSRKVTPRKAGKKC